MRGERRKQSTGHLTTVVEGAERRRRNRSERGTYERVAQGELPCHGHGLVVTRARVPDDRADVLALGYV